MNELIRVSAPQSATDRSDRAQASFRAILRAFSYPGEVCAPGAETGETAPDGAAIERAAECLFDADVSVWLAPAFDTVTMRRLLRRLTDCRFTDAAETADFGLADAAAMPRLDRLRRGTRLRPDLSATLIVSVPALTGGPEVWIEGPGIEVARRVAPVGLSEFFWDDWHANASLYPLGVDILMTDKSRYLGLPRTSRRRI